MIIKKILNYILTRYVSKPVINYFNTSFEKKVLISYITKPFRKGVSHSHSNRLESLVIADIFNKLGYKVDIYDFYSKRKVNYSDYNLVFGIGDLYENSLRNKDLNIIYIYYATGAYFEFQNTAEMSRIIQLYKRKGILLNPIRLIKTPRYLATQLSDAIISIGNEWTVSTYINSNMPIYNVPVSVYNISEVNFRRNISIAKTKFIWMGSQGLVHKGLDLCIEAFKDFPNLELHIFGTYEKKFFDIYKNELKQTNIIYHGFVDILGYKFKEVVKTCMFSIYPSCSEGQSGSLLTTMSMGLIPIASVSSGVDLINKGFVINVEIEDIKKKIKEVVEMNDKDLEKLSLNNIKFIDENHRIKNFEKTFEKNLNIILKNNG